MKAIFKLLSILAFFFFEANCNEIPRRFLEDEDEVADSTPSTPTDDSNTESDEEREERLQREIAELNAQTQKAFENTFDMSEDYSFDDID
jgi:hypothetical protein